MPEIVNPKLIYLAGSQRFKLLKKVPNVFQMQSNYLLVYDGKPFGVSLLAHIMCSVVMLKQERQVQTLAACVHLELTQQAQVCCDFMHGANYWGPHMLMVRLLNIVLAIGALIFVMHTKIVTNTLALIDRFL
jgi:hypothetical protein